MARPTLPDAALRAAARRVYGEDPLGYETGRPDDPDRVFELLVERCGLRDGSRVLEIGPGSGRATRRLLTAGAHVTALEPDPAFAGHLRVTLDPERLAVIGVSFEDAAVPDGQVDLVVAAMAFHWVDQGVGLPKLRRVLRPGGWVALWWTAFGDPGRPDPFRDALHALHPALTGPPPGDRPPMELDGDGWSEVLTREAGLVDAQSETIGWTARFDLEELRAFHATTIAVRRLPPAEQQRVLDDLVALARTRFGGVVERPFATGVHLARRPAP
jgi:SAM-dependent methyltransferase